MAAWVTQGHSGRSPREGDRDAGVHGRAHVDEGGHARGAHEAHNADLAIQDDEQVNFKHAWADPESGMVFCLSEAPGAAAVQRIHERAGHPADQIYEVPVQA